MAAGGGGVVGGRSTIAGGGGAMGGRSIFVLVMVSKWSLAVKHYACTGPKPSHMSTFLHAVSPSATRLAVCISYQRVLLVYSVNSRHAHRSISTARPLSLAGRRAGTRRVCLVFISTHDKTRRTYNSMEIGFVAQACQPVRK